MFLREIITEIDIEAPPERVWQHLTDFAAYPVWNPFIAGIEGEPRPGSRLLVKMRQPGGKEMMVRTILKTVEPPKKLVWFGRVLLPGLLDNEHSFIIEDKGDGISRLIQSETFSGFFALFLPRVLGEQTTLGFEMLNEVLKERVEQADARDKGQIEGPVSGSED